MKPQKIYTRFECNLEKYKRVFKRFLFVDEVINEMKVN